MLLVLGKVPQNSAHTSVDNLLDCQSSFSPSAVFLLLPRLWLIQAFILLPGPICTNLPATSHAGHASPKHQGVHRPSPFIFLYAKLFSPRFNTQIKCQFLCKAGPLLIQTCPLFPVLTDNTLLLRNATQNLKFACLKWLLATRLLLWSNLAAFGKSHHH